MGANTFARMARLQRDWMMTADLDKYEASVQALVEVGTRAQMVWVSVWETWLALGDLWRGRWEAARDRAEDTASREPPGFLVGWSWAVLFLCECLLDHKETALAGLEERRSGLPRTGRPNTDGAWTMLFYVIEGLAVLRERQAAVELYPLTLEAIEIGTVVSPHSDRLVQTVAGIAAAAGGQWEEAETHYQKALNQAREIPFRSEQPEVRRWYAQMLIDRNASGDRDRARTMLGEAVKMYEQIGMPKHVEMAKELLKTAL